MISSIHVGLGLRFFLSEFTPGLCLLIVYYEFMPECPLCQSLLLFRYWFLYGTLLVHLTELALCTIISTFAYYCACVRSPDGEGSPL